MLASCVLETRSSLNLVQALILDHRLLLISAENWYENNILTFAEINKSTQ